MEKDEVIDMLKDIKNEILKSTEAGIKRIEIYRNNIKSKIKKYMNN